MGHRMKINKKIYDNIGDPVLQKSNISKLLDLGYKPVYSMEQSIKETVDWIIRDKQ